MPASERNLNGNWRDLLTPRNALIALGLLLLLLAALAPALVTAG